MSWLPASAAEMTATWLESVLREGGLGGVSVVGVDVAAVGTRGLIGTLARLRIRYADDGLPRGPETLIAKFSPPAGSDTEALRPLSVVEARVYAELLRVSPIRSPRCFFAGAEDGEAVLILEDIVGHSVVRQLEGCSAARAFAAVEGIGRLHGRWLGRPMPDWLPSPVDCEIARRSRAILDAPALAWHPALRDLAPRLRRGFDSVARHLSSGAQTLVHGDFHCENLLFDPVDDEAPPVVLDFQMAMRGRGAADVARLLATSLLPGLRREIEGELLRTYVDVVREEGARDYGLDDCELDIRYGLLWELAARLAIVGHGREVIPGEWAPMPILERSLEAIHDWRAAELLPA